MHTQMHPQAEACTHDDVPWRGRTRPSARGREGWRAGDGEGCDERRVSAGAARQQGRGLHARRTCTYRHGCRGESGWLVAGCLWGVVGGWVGERQGAGGRNWEGRQVLGVLSSACMAGKGLQDAVHTWLAALYVCGCAAALGWWGAKAVSTIYTAMHARPANAMDQNKASRIGKDKIDRERLLCHAMHAGREGRV